ncbi:MAG: type VI secretion system contractile sheath large subunit [Pseudomonadota bacterium]|nr:type VI secretion system contractile sheath large subunit [Pseudomonadota bacterium]
MNAETEKAPAGAAAPAAAAKSLLDQAIEFTRQTPPERTKDLIGALVDKALEGTVAWDKNLALTLKKAMAAIDEKISRQLAAIMHHPRFQTLEGTWRGLHYLVMNSETGDNLQIRVLNLSKRELFKDLDKAVEFDQSQIFKKIYSAEFDMAGGTPYGTLIGDYEFTNHPEDIALLQGISQVAAAAFAPFIAAASPALFGFDDWTELARPRDLASGFRGDEHIKWRSYRETPDARFVTLTLPRALARLPYGERTRPVEEFAYEEAPPEVVRDAAGRETGRVARAAAHREYCWMNAAYVLGARLTDAFAKYGWCTAIRGAEGGGKVYNLPVHVFTSDDGDTDIQCPTEVGITDRREAELSKLGFLPLCHYKKTDYAVFFGAQTTHRPRDTWSTAEANANEAVSARLPYLLATSRFAHYLKVMARDWIGAFKEREDVEKDLNKWILNYVNANPNASQEQRARYPLREARIEVAAIPGKPGSYNAVAYLRPWLQLEELTAALSMVAEIPKPGGG